MSAARGVRRINEPAPADVRLGADGRPARVAWRTAPGTGGRARGRASFEEVEAVLDTWYVDDAWWTDRPVRRIYHEVQLATGMRLVVSWDLVTEQWMAQR